MLTCTKHCGGFCRISLTRPIKAAVVQSGSDVSIDRRVVYLPKWVFRTNVTADFGIVTEDFGPS